MREALGVACVDSTHLAEVVQNFVPAFVEYHSRPGWLDFPTDGAGVIKVRIRPPIPLPPDTANPSSLPAAEHFLQTAGRTLVHAQGG